MSRRLWLVAGLLLGCYPTADGSAAGPYDGTLKSFKEFISENKDQLNGWSPPAVLEKATMADGAALRYARWDPPLDKARRGTVVYFSGRTEFIERNTLTYTDLAQAGWEVWTFDWRGQGLSDGRLPDDKAIRGHIKDFGVYVGDAKKFVDDVVHIKDRPGSHVLLAHSMGGQIALRYLEAHPGDFGVVVMSSPLVRLPGGWIADAGEAVKDALGMEQPCVLGRSSKWQASFVRPACEVLPETVEAQLRSKDDTHAYTSDLKNLARAECLVERSLEGGNGPGLAVACPTAGWLVAAKDSTDDVFAHFDALTMPILIVAAKSDSAVDPEGQIDLCDRLGRNCTLVQVPSAGHEILIEKPAIRAAFIRCFEAFTTDTNSGGKVCSDAVQSIQ